jgi:hypothetical protein
MYDASGGIRYLSSRHEYFDKIVGRARKSTGWQNDISNSI